ncbi:TRAP transporter large permease [Alkalilimnicola sp. S0819]|uniref:TRAP transporter large permease n=1 Tax=Alkalilimnicola sp. S0819 TaxID=2613922 RepID=UPI001262A823|nr:TRAP transporter large permease [Alkalilimnicola sp. S0819]KAB7623336.1 TRAP transporter large permease [Alkalilimnicola sp. S0819]MPQ16875.1 TRAP transporter large permease subunit [Alkalilimnicola sp. S0819]
MAWFLLFIPLVLVLLGLPVFVGLLAAAAVGIVVIMDVPGMAVHQYLFASLDKSALLAIPFFLFAGELMARGTQAHKLMDWAGAGMGRLPGSTGVATVGASTFFGAISGSSVATVGAIGRISHGRMLEEGYDTPFAQALIASSAAIASVIPPSIAMILYGIAAEESAAELFIAGIIPGFVLALCLALYIAWRAGRRTAGEAFSLRRLLRATRRAWLALGMPVVVLGGIYLGILSPTEAAGAACAYAILVTLFAEPSLRLADLWQSAVRAMHLTAQTLVIVAASGVFAWMLTVNGIPQALAGWLTELPVPGWVLLIAINLLLLVVGCFMDTASAILVMTPLLLPIAVALGVDPVHFGIIMTLNLSIGMFTPPIGLNIFIVQGLFRGNLPALYRALLPFIAVSLVALLLVTFIPSLSLWLVGR